MKKNLTLLSAVLLFFLGCAMPKRQRQTSLEDWMKDNEKIKVLSTTCMIHDIVRMVGKDKIDALPLITGDIDPHNYELVKGDSEKLSRAAIIFSNGLGLEHGASLRYSLEHHPNTIYLGDLVFKKKKNEFLISDGQIDPHIWLDILLWAEIVDPIVANLSRIAPQWESEFIENGAKVKQSLILAHEKLFQRLQKIPPENRFLVTSHDAFNYFAKRYLAEPHEIQNQLWKKRFAAPEGLAPDGQLSVLDIQKIVEHLTFYQIEMLFPESNVSRDSLRKISSVCQKKGIHVKVVKIPIYGDTMGSASSEANTYIKMMEYNGKVISNNLESGH